MCNYTIVVNHLKRKLIRYGILIALGYFILKPMIPIGDYCGGLLTVLNFFFFGGLLVLALLIITIIDVIRNKKTKEKFDFIPLVLTLTIGISYFLILHQDESKFWTERKLTGWIAVESTPKSGLLRLYKNGTFAATLHNADYSCTFQGDYEMNNNRLKLNRLDLSEVTQKVFTTEYIVNEQSNTLQPTDKSYGIIQVRE